MNELELLPCPFCGSKRVEFTPDEEQYDELNTTTGFIWCHGCDFSSDSFYSRKIAVEKWNRRAQPANEPLTMEELRGMDDPVWCACDTFDGKGGFWCLCQEGVITPPSCMPFEAGERPDWVFYRRKPEPEGAQP